MNKNSIGVFLFSLILLLSCNCTLKNNSLQEMTIAFQYHKPSQEDLNFLSGFDMVVTGNFWDAETIKILKARNVKLIYYDWLPAFYYCGNHTDWEEMLYQNRNFWILDPGQTAPDPLGERYNCRDFFYDMGDNDLITARVDHIVSEIRANQYDGVFFDWGSGWYSLEENKLAFVMDEFRKRHPGTDYNDKAGEFIKKLKKKDVLVIVNGGFRSEDAKMDSHADFDIVESMFTTTECDNSYEIYSFPDGVQTVCDTWYNNVESSIALAASLPAKAKAANPAIQFLFLNYIFPYYIPSGEKTILEGKSYRVYEKTADRQAIYYSMACSYMGGSAGFVNGHDVSLDSAIDDIYNYRLGKSLSNIIKLEDNIYIRYFLKGFVVVSETDSDIKIALPGNNNKVFDLYEKKQMDAENGKITLHLASQVYPSGKKYPVGRIYLYGHR